MNGSSASGSRQDEKQNDAQAGMDDGSRQGRQPVFEWAMACGRSPAYQQTFPATKAANADVTGSFSCRARPVPSASSGSALPRSPQRVARRLEDRAPATGTPLVLGLLARSRALLAAGWSSP